ncbi:hypothetical protein Tco_1342431 [Tanacetum coccineum]
MKCTGKTKKSGRIEKVNMEESAEEESEVEKHDDDIGLETESEDEEEMVKKTKKGKMHKKEGTINFKKENHE